MRLYQQTQKNWFILLSSRLICMPNRQHHEPLEIAKEFLRTAVFQSLHASASMIRFTPQALRRGCWVFMSRLNEHHLNSFEIQILISWYRYWCAIQIREYEYDMIWNDMNMSYDMMWYEMYHDIDIDIDMNVDILILIWYWHWYMTWWRSYGEYFSNNTDNITRRSSFSLLLTRNHKQPIFMSVCWNNIFSSVHSLQLTQQMKMDGWKMKISFGMPHFRCYVCFRQCIDLYSSHQN